LNFTLSGARFGGINSGMVTSMNEPMLADRLGMSVHVSPLRIRLLKLAKKYPVADAKCLEDWLLDVANARGARIVTREHEASLNSFVPPARMEFSDEELIVAICQLQGADRPQLLRLAGQMISRGNFDVVCLIRTAVRERAEPVLKAMAQQALKVAPDHPAWVRLAEAFPRVRTVRDAVLHWTRLAEAVPVNGRCNAASWRLVA
jgi:hypothetical protein